jgi:hypothetical protein
MKLFWKKNHVFWKLREELKKYKKKSKYWENKYGEKDEEKRVELSRQKESYDRQLKSQKDDLEGKIKSQKEELESKNESQKYFYEGKLKSHKDEYESKLKENTRKIDRRITRYNKKNYRISEQEMKWDESIIGLMSFVGKVETEVYDKTKFIDEALRKMKEALDNIALVKSSMLEIGHIKGEIAGYAAEKEKKMLKAVK